MRRHALTISRPPSKLLCGRIDQGANTMPSFLKNPKFIIGAIVVLWVAYIVEENFRLDPITIRLVPFVAALQLRVSAVIIGAAVFGSVATLVVQFLWRRRSKNASSPQPAASSKTVA
jgi:hypothetical protein